VDCGARGVKIYSHVTAGVAGRISAAAHGRGLKVWAHSFVWPATPEQVITAGADVVSHAPGLLLQRDWVPGTAPLEFDPAEVDSPSFSNILTLMREHGVMLDPTLAIYDMRFAADTTGAGARKRRALWEAVRRVHQAGIPLVVGTDLPPPRAETDPPPLYAEMEILVDKVGLTPLEVMTAVTRNNAIALGIEGSHGTIEPGKAADIVVCDSDPTECLPRVEGIILVIKGGRIVSQSTGGEQ
jgi:imidazolonepropionase-like amidohydrolase